MFVDGAMRVKRASYCNTMPTRVEPQYYFILSLRPSLDEHTNVSKLLGTEAHTLMVASFILSVNETTCTLSYKNITINFY